MLQSVDMSDHDDRPVPEPQGRFVGLPYDFRRPTAARARARFWNPNDRRILTPKTFGWGLDLNLYWIVHPTRFIRARRQRR